MLTLAAAAAAARIEAPTTTTMLPRRQEGRGGRRRVVVMAMTVVTLALTALVLLSLAPVAAAVKRASASAPAAGGAGARKPPTAAAAGGSKKAKAKGAVGKGAAGKGVCSSAEAAADALLVGGAGAGEGDSSSITIHLLQEKEGGQTRRLTLPKGTTPTALRHHLLAQGLVAPGAQAEGLKIRRKKEGSRPVTQGLSSASELLSGDVIIIAPAAKPSAAASGAGTKSTAVGTGASSSEASGAFVPYPQYAHKGRGSGGQQARSFSELELYKVTKQERAHASLVEVDPEAVGAFIGRVAEGETRVGLLFGRVETVEPSAASKAKNQPVRGRAVNVVAASDGDGRDGGGRRVVVRVAAVWEVDGGFQRHGPGHTLNDRGLYQHFHHQAASSASSSSTTKSKPKDDDDAATASRNPDVARAMQVAKHLGLYPVGWVVARPGGMVHSNNGEGGGFLNAQEVLITARLQIEALREAGRAVGDGFVTLAVNTTGAAGGKQQAGAQHSVEAFQVSQQAVQMLWDGLLDERKAGPTQAVPTTSDVFVSGDTRHEVDAAFLTLPIGISAPSGANAAALFKRTGPPIADDEALREALLGPADATAAAQKNKRDRNRVYPAHVVPPPPSLLDAPPRWLDTRPKPLLTRLSDFHLLVYLARYLRTAELEKLCTAVGAFGRGAPVATKEGGAGKGKGKGGGGVSVPPAVRALLEALCDEG